MPTEVGAVIAGRGWRPLLWYRFALIVGQAFLVTPATGYVWFTLWPNQVTSAGWFVVPCAVAAWAWPAVRTWTVSAQLTRGTLLIRNVFSTERAALADITKVAFHRDRLTITERPRQFSVDVISAAPAGRHRDPGNRHPISAIAIGGIARHRECPAAPTRPPMSSRRGRAPGPPAPNGGNQQETGPCHNPHRPGFEHRGDGVADGTPVLRLPGQHVDVVRDVPVCPRFPAELGRCRSR